MKKGIPIIVIVILIDIVLMTLSSCSFQENSDNTDLQSGDSTKESVVEATLSKQSLKCTDGSTLSYWLYTPENSTDNMPLLIYLHGGSGKGNDLDIVMQNGFPKYLKEGALGKIPAYIVIPQLSGTMKGWTDIKGLIKELINYCDNTYSVDTNRISLTGHSMGGTGTWNLALAFPTLFSCIVPMSGSITTNDANIKALSQMPVWTFVGSADTIVRPQPSQDFISALKIINQSAKITIFQDATHFDIPELSYLDTDINIIQWLISNSKY